MKITAKSLKNFQTEIENEKGYKIISDLPKSHGGDNEGATSLEIVTMGLSSCISSVFLLVASKMRLNIENIIVEIDSEKTKEGNAIASSTAVVKVKSLETEKKLQNCLESTIQNCPVGIIFEKAGIPVEHKLIILN